LALSKLILKIVEEQMKKNVKHETTKERNSTSKEMEESNS
jgi:hypothetical protein